MLSGNDILRSISRDHLVAMATIWLRIDRDILDQCKTEGSGDEICRQSPFEQRYCNSIMQRLRRVRLCASL